MGIVPCRCCGFQTERVISDDWAECLQCGVFVNSFYKDTPIARADGIRQVPKEIIADITKFVSILDLLHARGPLYDVCAGYGTLPYLCYLRGIDAGGNEISPGAIELAADLFGVTLEYGQFEELRHRVDLYSEIVFHHGIEHVVNPMAAVRKAIQMLVPGGQIYLAHPAMRDREWVVKYGSYAHQHEWTYESFRYFIGQFNNLEVTGSGCGEFTGPEVGQWWIARKVEVMRHTVTKNGIVSYELEPEDSDDRHVIEIFKGRNKVSMRQSSRGGIIFDLEKGIPAVVDETPIDLTDAPRVSKP